MKISALLTRSLVEINAADAGGTIQPEVFSLALETLNMILDQLNVNGRALVAEKFSTYTITANLNPHTIGVTGATWTYPIARPSDIAAASVILSGTPAVYVPLRKLTAQEWQAATVPGLAVTLSQAFYYDPTYPNGSFYFYLKASTAYQVQLQTMQQLAQVVLADDFTLPQGYHYVLMLLTAKACAGPLRKVWKPEQEQTLVRVQGETFGANGLDLTLATADYGLPVSGAVRNNWNWRTGQTF